MKFKYPAAFLQISCYFPVLTYTCQIDTQPSSIIGLLNYTWYLMLSFLLIFETDMGVERGIRLEGLTEEQISKALEELVKVGASLKS